MARIRSVKPDVRRSLTVAEWPREVRLTWIYLWMYLDDQGRGLDDMRLIVAELYPLDRDVTERKMDRWLTMMATTKTAEDDTPPLCRYEVNGRRYLHAVKWRDHQKINRPQPSRLPPCPVHEQAVNLTRTSSLRAARTDSVSAAVSDSVSGSRTAARKERKGKERKGKEGKVDDDLGGHRYETLPPANATDPPPDPHLARCTAHTGHPYPPPCRGCAQARQAATDAAAAATEAAEHARANCPDCHGTGWTENPDGTPAAKCTHPQARSYA